MRTASPGMVTRAIRRTVALEILASATFCCEVPQAATHAAFWAATFDALSARAAASANGNTLDLPALNLPARDLRARDLLAIFGLPARPMRQIIRSRTLRIQGPDVRIEHGRRFSG